MGLRRIPDRSNEPRPSEPEPLRKPNQVKADLHAAQEALLSLVAPDDLDAANDALDALQATSREMSQARAGRAMKRGHAEGRDQGRRDVVGWLDALPADQGLREAENRVRSMMVSTNPVSAPKPKVVDAALAGLREALVTQARDEERRLVKRLLSKRAEQVEDRGEPGSVRGAQRAEVVRALRQAEGAIANGEHRA